MTKQVSTDQALRIRARMPGRTASGKSRNHTEGGKFIPGNRAAIKHGVYATVYVTHEEKKGFLALRQEIAREFKNETGPDTAMLDAAALLFMRHGRAVVADEQDLANKTMTSILAMLDRLKATRASREGEKPVRAITPAEWASDLLAKGRDHCKNTATSASRAQDDIIEAET